MEIKCIKVNTKKDMRQAINDTANEVGTIEQCLYSLGNRVEVAKILNNQGESKLLNTIMEDLAFFVQSMLDEYCVVK